MTAEKPCSAEATCVPEIGSGEPVDIEKARNSHQRLVDVAFRNLDCETGQPVRPHFEIPAHKDDDDIIVSRALDELEVLRRERATGVRLATPEAEHQARQEHGDGAPDPRRPERATPVGMLVDDLPEIVSLLSGATGRTDSTILEMVRALVKQNETGWRLNNELEAIVRDDAKSEMGKATETKGEWMARKAAEIGGPEDILRTSKANPVLDEDLRVELREVRRLVSLSRENDDANALCILDRLLGRMGEPGTAKAPIAPGHTCDPDGDEYDLRCAGCRAMQSAERSLEGPQHREGCSLRGRWQDGDEMCACLPVKREPEKGGAQ